MSILAKLSDVLKEVFWIKTTKKRKSSSRPKKASKKKVKKTSKKLPSRKIPPAKATRKPVEKAPKKLKPAKPVKASKPPKVKAVVSKKPLIDPNLVAVGEITHYFDRIKVSVVKINQGTVLIGDKLTIIGSKTRFVQKVWSMQVESLDVKVARKGQVIGLKVDKPVVVGDVVYK